MKTIKVERWMIDTGRPKSPCMCPVAIALESNGYKHVAVYGSHFTHGDFGARIKVNCPSSVGEFVEKFDSREKVSPFEFEIV